VGKKNLEALYWMYICIWDAMIVGLSYRIVCSSHALTDCFLWQSNPDD